MTRHETNSVLCDEGPSLSSGQPSRQVAKTPATFTGLLPGSSAPQRQVSMKQSTGKLRQLWKDTSGNASVVSMLLVVVIVALGAVVGLSTFRDQVVQEFGDVAVSLNHLDQSFDYTIEVDANGDGDLNDPQDQVFTGTYIDTDVGDLMDGAGTAPACLVIN